MIIYLVILGYLLAQDQPFYILSLNSMLGYEWICGTTYWFLFSLLFFLPRVLYNKNIKNIFKFDKILLQTTSSWTIYSTISAICATRIPFIVTIIGNKIIIPITVIIRMVFYGRTYTWWQHLGWILVLVGIGFTMVPNFESTNLNFYTILYFLGCLPATISYIKFEDYLVTNTDMALIYTKSMILQLLMSLPLLLLVMIPNFPNYTPNVFIYIYGSFRQFYYLPALGFKLANQFIDMITEYCYMYIMKNKGTVFFLLLSSIKTCLIPIYTIILEKYNITFLTNSESFKLDPIYSSIGLILVFLGTILNGIEKNIKTELEYTNF
jgi:hypothetical protein